LMSRKKGRNLSLQFALLVILISLLAPGSSLQVAGGQSAPQELCVENPRNPVLNDTNGYNYTTPTGDRFAYNNTFQEPTVMRVANQFRMWYAGDVEGIWGIYTAVSNDGANWTADTTPVLSSGPNGTWDYTTLLVPSVVYNGTGYLMYFRASNGTSFHTRSIGVAFSSDGVHWKEYAGNPILRPGPGLYDSNWILAADVVFHNGTYLMWYAASPSTTTYHYAEAINFATSTDGVLWVKYAGNPVFLGASDEWGTVGHPDVLDLNGTFLMLYGNGYGIRYAISQNGTSWSYGGDDLVRSAQAFWKSDFVSDPAGILNGSRLILWYYGNSPVASQSSAYIGGIGLAQCDFVYVRTSITKTITNTETVVNTASFTSTLILTSTVVGPPSPVSLLVATAVFISVLAIVLLYFLVVRRQG